MKGSDSAENRATLQKAALLAGQAVAVGTYGVWQQCITQVLSQLVIVDISR